jgi:acyl carrier protein
MTAELVTQVTAVIGAMAREQPPPLHRGARLLEDLGYDSLRLIELAIALEALPGIELAPEDVAGARTVGDVLGALSRRRENPIAT